MMVMEAGDEGEGSGDKWEESGGWVPLCPLQIS